MKKVVFLLFILFFTQSVSSQQFFTTEETKPDDHPEIIQKINVVQDSTLTEMLKWHIENNTQKGGIDGFRIEIFFSRDNNARQKSMEIKKKFLSKYPDVGVKIKYNHPYFKVRVGNFRTVNEALKFKNKIEHRYRYAFIVKDIIEFPVLEVESLN